MNVFVKEQSGIVNYQKAKSKKLRRTKELKEEERIGGGYVGKDCKFPICLFVSESVFQCQSEDLEMLLHLKIRSCFKSYENPRHSLRYEKTDCNVT